MTGIPDGFLLERGRELAQVDGALERARTGSGCLVLVEGPAGIGKTRLLTAVRRKAQATGLRVLVARCAELEREFSFGAVRQLFERLVAAVPAPAGSVLAGPAAPAAALLDPAIDPMGPLTFAEDSRFAAFNALFWLTVNVAADGPVVLGEDRKSVV